MNATSSPRTRGIHDPEMRAERDELIALLQTAYWKEIETVISYVANSINPDGVRAQEISRSLAEDVGDELAHARRLGERIKQLNGVVPGSLEFAAEQSYLQPPSEQTDVVHVVKGVIEAENEAIETYHDIVRFCEGRDPVTQDIAVAILHEEERHRRLFEGFLREYIPGA